MDVRVGHKESWAPKNWCFWTVVLEKTLRVPWTARRSNQSILKEISPEYIHWNDSCWSWSSNTLATSCKEQTYLWRPSCWGRLEAGGEGDDGGWDGWMHTDSMDMSLSKLWRWWWAGQPGVLQYRVSKSGTRLSNWTTTVSLVVNCFLWIIGRRR